MEQEVRGRLTAVFRDVFDDEALVVNDAMTAADVVGWDSLSHVTLVVAVEKAFGAKFTIKEIGALANVGDLVALVVRKTGTR